MKFPGSATAEGTLRYRRRFSGEIPADHFRETRGLWMSSLGIGTYLGNYDAATDRQYHDAVVLSVESGANVIDTAVNYRCQRSERAVGGALAELASRGFGREEIVVATKGGFIPYDGTPPDNPRRYLEENFLKTGIITGADIVSGCHCMTPRYLEHQLELSLGNLGLSCIDIYFLHNPETQLGKISREEFNRRLVHAFECLEKAADTGRIRMYGTATWNGYRSDIGAKDYLSLAEVASLAEQAGGKKHRFKVIQLPFNLGMTEALSAANQTVGSERKSTLAAAQALGIAVLCSAPVLQGQLTRNLPAILGETFPEAETAGQQALQFVRSTPGVTTALVGMKQLSHVRENLTIARVMPSSWEQYSKLFQSA